MDNYAAATPWRTRQARWSIPDMTRAVHLQCKFCNDADVFTDGNDCVSHVCPLFPFRPGSVRPEVNGVKRAIRKVQTGGKAFPRRGAGATKPLEPTNDPERGSQAKVTP